MITRAVLFGAMLAACEEVEAECADATTPEDCEATMLVAEGHTCGWARIERFASGSCEVEATREACVEFAGTQAGCQECGETDDVLFHRDGELLVTSVCGPVPPGFEHCGEGFWGPECECREC